MPLPKGREQGKSSPRWGREAHGTGEGRSPNPSILGTHKMQKDPTKLLVSLQGESLGHTTDNTKPSSSSCSTETQAFIKSLENTTEPLSCLFAVQCRWEGNSQPAQIQAGSCCPLEPQGIPNPARGCVGEALGDTGAAPHLHWCSTASSTPGAPKGQHSPPRTENPVFLCFQRYKAVEEPCSLRASQ